jgi:L-ascorbate metabolism protein UlaG (beta-lactamase superfamily)
MSTKLKSQRIDPSFFDKREDTVVTWLGMAGALINTRGTILFIDPLITVVEPNSEQICESGHRLKISLPIEAKDVPRADAVLYTHADSDHFGRLTAKTFATRLRPKFLAPPPVRLILKDMGIDGFYWLLTQQGKQDMGVDGERIVTARHFKSVRIGDAEVVITPALHGWQKKNPWKREDACGFLVKTPDGTIWHPGDTWLIDELLEVRGVDVLFFDVAAANSHLGPMGSARLAETSGAKVMIAYHYGTFDLPPGLAYASSNPEDSLPHVKDLSASLLLLNPGELLRLPC